METNWVYHTKTKLEKMMDGHVVDMLLLVNYGQKQELPAPECSNLNYLIANGTYYIGLRLDVGEPRVSGIWQIEGSERKDVTLKLMQFPAYAETTEIVGNITSNAMASMQIPQDSFFKKGRICLVTDSEAIKQLDTLAEAAD
jgi:hypothetical protein